MLNDRDDDRRTYVVLLLVKHKRSYGPTGVGMVASLTMDTNGGMANAEMINSTRDSVRRGKHHMAVM